MLGEERKGELKKIESAQKIARYSEIIKLCGLELSKESSKPESDTFIDTIFHLTSAIDLEVGTFLALAEKEKNK